MQNLTLKENSLRFLSLISQSIQAKIMIYSIELLPRQLFLFRRYRAGRILKLLIESSSTIPIMPILPLLQQHLWLWVIRNRPKVNQLSWTWSFLLIFEPNRSRSYRTNKKCRRWREIFSLYFDFFLPSHYITTAACGKVKDDFHCNFKNQLQYANTTVSPHAIR